MLAMIFWYDSLFLSFLESLAGVEIRSILFETLNMTYGIGLGFPAGPCVVILGLLVGVSMAFEYVLIL